MTMSHHTATRRHARKAVAAMIIAVAALGLTACQDDGTGAAPSSASTSASQDPTSKAAEDTAQGTPKEDGVKCTDQINYAGDSRSNAEINTIGEETGYCPPVKDQ